MINRRDFLKLLGLGSAAMVMPITSLELGEMVENEIPSERAIVLIECFIAGYYYYDGEDLEELGLLNPGDALTLTREPDNPYDGNAICVSTTRNEKLGYIPRVLNPVIARIMDQDVLVQAIILDIYPDQETW